MRRLFLVFLLVLSSLAVFLVLRQGSDEKNPTVTIRGKTFSVEVADTDEERVRGLSGRETLEQSEGMLFLFDEPNYYTFWMKDMRFPIDILFINGTKIITIHENVPNPSPDTPLSQLPRYQPKEPANMVLEINAGLSKSYGFQVGDTIEIRGLP